MPELVKEIINLKNELDDTAENYIKHFDRLVDPVIMGIFYGLYASRSLPPMSEKINLSHSNDFNVDISPFPNIFNHLLFCLWLHEHGFPSETSDILQYRKKLYDFISLLINPEYYRDVLIPFYLQEACKDKELVASFFFRLWNSGGIGITESVNSPEFLCLEFDTIQQEFFNDIIKPLENKISITIKSNEEH